MTGMAKLTPRRECNRGRLMQIGAADVGGSGLSRGYREDRAPDGRRTLRRYASGGRDCQLRQYQGQWHGWVPAFTGMTECGDDGQKWDWVSAMAHRPMSGWGRMPSSSSKRPLAESSTRVSARESMAASLAGSSKYITLTMRR